MNMNDIKNHPAFLAFSKSNVKIHKAPEEKAEKEEDKKNKEE